MIFGKTCSDRLVRPWRSGSVFAALAALAAALGVGAMSGPSMASGASRTTAKTHAASAQQCPEPYPAERDPSNPLMLPAAPGPDPLHGASFFIDGPRHGAAAKAIAGL